MTGMGNMRVDWDGLDSLLRALVQTGAEAARDLVWSINDEAALVFRDSQRQVPYKTGALRSSGRQEAARIEGSTIVAEITYGNAGAQYAEHVHEGTRPHVIRAKDAQVLRFKGSGGEWVFRGEVQHPGTTGVPYLREPMELAAPQMPDRIARRLQQRLDRRFK